MDQELLLNITNALLGLATLALWGIVVVGLVREVLDRKKPLPDKPLLFLLPHPGGSATSLPHRHPPSGPSRRKVPHPASHKERWFWR